MWLFHLFSFNVTCPRCVDPTARRALWGTVKCPNRNCEHFSQELIDYREEAKRAAELGAAIENLVTRSWVGPDGFDPVAHRIEVSYENHLGERKTFTGDWRTLRRRGRHVSLRVLPTGIRIALAIDRIQNLAGVEPALQQSPTPQADVERLLQRFPTPQEARVMRYHARRGTTSARCEELRRNYPDWSPLT